MENQSTKNLNENLVYKVLKKIDPLGDGISLLELLRVAGSDLDIANAARVSYGKISYELSEKDVKLINFLVEHDHTSPLEHNQLSFRVKAPMFVVRQWMRHRMNSYNEISYRYANAPTEFYIPSNWRFQHKINHQASEGSFQDAQALEKYKHSLDVAFKTYEELLEKGVCRELARGVLPVCIYTQFIFTCNLHSLLHFLKLRLGHGAQSEIREYAKGMLDMANDYFPVAINAWKKKNDMDNK